MPSPEPRPNPAPSSPASSSASCGAVPTPNGGSGAGGSADPAEVRADGPGAGSLTDAFTAARPWLVGLAYRITGSRLDAEDIVQDAWLRARQADWAAIERPDAWLTTVVSRLALDHLRSATRRRETYVGPWLPEPVRSGDLDPAHPPPPDPADLAERSESLTFGFLRLLETLSPVERVVFLLAEVFDTPYREIAPVVDRSPETCRKIASRARRHVQAGRVRHDPNPEAAEVATALLVAVNHGDVDRVVSLLAEDVVLVSDGGEQAHAARLPVHGPDRVARLMVNLARRRYRDLRIELATINREPGIVAFDGDQPFLTLSVEVADGAVRAVHAVVSPDKLAALDLTTPIV